MRKTSIQAQAGEHIKLLTYGKAGSGKTWLSYSASVDERTSPVLAIDCIGNPGSVFGMAKDVTLVQLDNIKDLSTIIDFLLKDQPKDHLFRKLMGLDNSIRFKTLIIDSLTEIQTMMLEAITGADKIVVGENRPQTQIQHFGQVLGQTLNFIKVIMKLPLNIICTALEDEDRNAQNVVTKYDILLQGKAKQQVPGIFHTLCRTITFNKFPPTYLDAINKEAVKQGIKLTPTTNIGLFAPIGNFEAKDQGKPQLPSYIIQPTISKILDIREVRV